MAKCNYCGELNPESGLFCSQCGKPLEKPRPSPAEVAMDKAKAEFERSASVNIDRSKITYVCELCGTINNIDTPKCVRCGKPRPRSEFVAALRRIREASNEQQTENPYANAENAMQQPEAEYREGAAGGANGDQTIYRFVPGGGMQSSPVVQPFVVVPYVNSAQPLWQYNPNQIYRLEQPAQPAYQPATIADYVEEQIRQDSEYVLPEQTAPAASAKAGKIRLASVFSMLFSALVLVVLLALPVLAKAEPFKGIKVFESVQVLFSTVSLQQIGVPVGYINYDSNWFFLVPCGYILGALFALIVFIRALVRLIKGKAGTKGIVFSLIVLLCAVAAALGMFLVTANSGIGDFITAHCAYGLYCLVGGALALFITALCSPKEKKIK